MKHGIGLLLMLMWGLLVDNNGIITELTPANQQILWDIRLPRIMNALVCGASLALAGVLLQALLQNPMAEPYVLGVSGGGSVAAMLMLLFGLSSVWQIAGAFVGALLSLVVIYALANRTHAGFAFRLILSGIILASFWQALISLLLIASPNTKIPGMLFWLMGDLSNLNWPLISLLIFVLIFILSLRLTNAIDLLLCNEQMASSMGLSLRHIQWFLLIASSLLVASVVSVAGNIGFVGLIVPHIVRLLGKRMHRPLIWHSVLLGATMLIMADWLSRMVVAPSILPVGILTTMIGVPIFVYLLRKSHA